MGQIVIVLDRWRAAVPCAPAAPVRPAGDSCRVVRGHRDRRVVVHRANRRYRVAPLVRCCSAGGTICAPRTSKQGMASRQPSSPPQHRKEAPCPFFPDTSRSVLGAAVLGLAVLGGCANQARPAHRLPPPYSGGSPYGNGQATRIWRAVRACRKPRTDQGRKPDQRRRRGASAACWARSSVTRSARAPVARRPPAVGAIGGASPATRSRKAAAPRAISSASGAPRPAAAPVSSTTNPASTSAGRRVYVQGDQLMRY